MQYFDPKKYPKLLNEISMQEIECFYSTILKRRDGMKFYLTAPLLVCMALHGRISDVVFLVEKYPLVHWNGWTSALWEEEERTHRTLLQARGNVDFELEGTIKTAMAMCFFGRNGAYYNDIIKLWKHSKLTDGELNLLRRVGDYVTKYYCNHYSEWIND